MKLTKNILLLLLLGGFFILPSSTLAETDEVKDFVLTGKLRCQVSSSTTETCIVKEYKITDLSGGDVTVNNNNNNINGDGVFHPDWFYFQYDSIAKEEHTLEITGLGNDLKTLYKKSIKFTPSSDDKTEDLKTVIASYFDVGTDYSKTPTMRCYPTSLGKATVSFSYDYLTSGKATLWKDAETNPLVTYTGFPKRTSYELTGLAEGVEYNIILRDGTSKTSKKIISSVCKSGGATKINPFVSRIFPQCNQHPYKPLNCWLGNMFNYATVAVGMISVVVLMAAGVLYITSGGNQNNVSLAKKMIFNALMAIAVVVLANWFMWGVLGIRLGALNNY